MSKKEYVFIFIVWIILFVIYYYLLMKIHEITIHEGLIISFVTMTVIKSLYDIIFRTGSKNMYVYSDRVNQILRFVTMIILLLVASFYHYSLYIK